MSEHYKRSGVDIDAGNEFVSKITPLVKKTYQRGVLSGIGGFGAHFALDVSSIKEPVLVSGTDGVGTKLKIAIDLKKLGTIGIDLVAMCVNDIACSGARPLFFLDYFAMSKLDPKHHPEIISGIAEGCIQAKCALVGGETAEMPDFYSPGDFDLAGFAVGVVDKQKIIDGSDIGVQNAIVGLHSSGPHSNGYSLIRHVIKEKKLDLLKTYEGMGRPLGEILLAPTIIYSQIVEKLANLFHIKGIAHITGGGFFDNIPRILPAGVQAVIKRSSFDIPPIFRFIQRHGDVDDAELMRVFNCGIGMIMVAPAEEADDLAKTACSAGYKASVIGQMRKRDAGSEPIVFE
jgi:phosphoribosylformylglycinamidine cyclo-ligase